MIRGLVKQQQCGVGEQRAGQSDFHLPTARELGDRLVEVGRFEAEAGQHLFGALLVAVAAGGLEDGRRLVVGLLRRLHNCRALALGISQILQRDAHGLHGLGGLHLGDGLFEDVARRAGHRLLAQPSYRFSVDHQRSFVDAIVLRDGREQRRLAAAVRPDEHGACAPRQLQVHIEQDVVAAPAHRGLGQGDHRVAAAAGGSNRPPALVRPARGRRATAPTPPPHQQRCGHGAGGH
mmetsp:Transcript_82849/g.268426  ORF Transcript_82849/g.268426 Transcript_82849/m.268426 type:complete len:235 (+) Transcript_82849:1760-2464(+)